MLLLLGCIREAAGEHKLLLAPALGAHTRQGGTDCCC